MKRFLIILLVSFAVFSCKKDEHADEEVIKELTIFFVNDTHGQLYNFSKIKHIVDAERSETNVILTSAGDMFSGNPVVDIYDPKGYPMIDLMNKVGFDVMAVGNHEFDYGEQIFEDRMLQSDFPWLCANVDYNTTDITDPPEFTTITAGDVTVCFLGLIETNGQPDAVVPSTHPTKVENFTFQKAEDVVSNYSNLKTQEEADLYVALTHLGYYEDWDKFGDKELISQFPYFDLLIGGHSHESLNATVNNVPVVHAGSHLNFLGKIELKIQKKKIYSYTSEIIDLNTYYEEDQTIKTLINNYETSMSFLDDVIGYSHLDHTRYQIGCFYTDALLGYLSVDVSFQNYGGIRTGIDLGDITKREIYSVSPFNNGVLIYTMTVQEIKDFLKGCGAGFYYGGIQISQNGEEVEIRDTNGDIIPDNTVLSLGINDYIPTVHYSWFPDNGVLQAKTAAETLIAYLETINDQLNYSSCGRYFIFE